MTITEFLAARYDEREAAARAADIPEGDPSWTVHGPVALSSPDAFRVRTSRDMVPVALVQDIDDNTEPIPSEILDGQAVADHIALNDPAYVLADIAAKREIVALIDDPQRDTYEVHAVLVLLAEPYAEHPDFDPAWRV